MTAPVILLLIVISIVVATFLIWLFYMITTTYKEKFERNFLFNGTSVAILIGGAILYFGVIECNDNCVDIVAVMKFDPTLVAESVFFYIGAFILSLAWITNIRKSSFLWGMTQNIIQTIFVAIFSVVILIGALLAKSALGKIKDAAT